MPKDKIIEEIKRILKEVGENQKELIQTQKNTEKEVDKVSKEVDRLTKEVDKVSKEVDRLSKEVDRLSKEMHKVIRDVGKEIDKVNKTIGDLTDGWGKFVLGLTEPSISFEFEKLGFEVLSVTSPGPRRLDGNELEVDLLIISKFNGKPKVMVVEVKSAVNQQKIEKFIKRLREFKRFFFEYEKIDLMGGVAGVRFAEGSKERVIKEGLYLFSTSKGMMSNMNPAGFKPKLW